MPDEGYLINATPARVIVWPGGNSGEDYLAPPLNGTLYNPNTGLFHIPSTNESSFVNFCRSIDCTAIFQVPGEVNNSAFGAEIVQYTESTLGFHPWAWEIGNEPELWNHTSFPWTQWQNGISSNETPAAYAWEVNRYSTAMRAVDPSIRIIGLPGTGRTQNGGLPLVAWINATVQVNGPNLTAVAFHVYPGEVNTGQPGSGTPLENLSLFYAAIQSSAGLWSRVTTSRMTIANQTGSYWPGRSAPAVYVTEIGSGLSASKFHVTSLSAGFPGALSLAAQLTQAMSLNLTNIDLFQAVLDTANSWFDLQGNPRPDFALYSDLLSRLGPTAFNATFSGFNGTLYAIATAGRNLREPLDLLTVNTNLTAGVLFTPQLPVYVPGSPVEVWTWNGTFVDPNTNGGDPVNSTTPAPVGHFYPNGLPTSWLLPPQSLALFEALGAQAAPVVATQQGLEPSARWFLELDGRTLTADTPTISTFAPSGFFPVSAPALNVTDRSRTEPFPPGNVSVGVTPLAINVPFRSQWRINLTVSPTGSGTVSPDTGWWNVSTSLSLNVTAVAGYVFDRWEGYGPGNYSGPGTFISPTRNAVNVLVQGAISERARLLPGFPVTFKAVGLPAGTAWSVAVVYLGNFTALNQSTGATLSFLLPTGNWGYTVKNPPGYHARPSAGAVNVTGPNVIVVSIGFTLTTSPPKVWSWFPATWVLAALGFTLGVGIAGLAVLAVYGRKRQKGTLPRRFKPPPEASGQETMSDASPNR